MPEKPLAELFSDRFGTSPKVPDDLAAMSGLTQIAGRGSCRSFQPDPVDPTVLQTLCATALCAPSKSDLQQRDILIVTESGVLDTLKTLLGAQDWIADVPSMIVVLANNRRQRQLQDQHGEAFPNDHLDAFFNASLDAGIALATFVIAVEAAGLGCCPISTIRNHLTEVQELLDLPDHVFPVAGIAVGHPKTPPQISARLPLDCTVHLNSFSDMSAAQLRAYDERRRAGTDQPAWSEAKAKMYAKPQRTDFGDFIRKIGFNLD